MPSKVYTVKLWDDECKAGKHKGRTHFPNAVRLYIFDKYNHACCYCAKGWEFRLQIDHKVPFVLGGGNESSNLWVLCRLCNTSKGNRKSD